MVDNIILIMFPYSLQPKHVSIDENSASIPIHIYRAFIIKAQCLMAAIYNKYIDLLCLDVRLLYES